MSSCLTKQPALRFGRNADAAQVDIALARYLGTTGQET